MSIKQGIILESERGMNLEVQGVIGRIIFTIDKDGWIWCDNL